ncbi:MAG: S41 family peptidase [Microcystaceae cyanobacterium]
MNTHRIRHKNLLIVLLLATGMALLVGLRLPVFSTPSGANTSVFEQVWETVEENFYDPNFNGVDWQALRQKYEATARQAQSKKELALTINQMLSALKTSHTHFYTPEEPEYYQLLAIFQPGSSQLQQQIKKWFPKGKIEYSGIGLFTRQIEGQTFVSGVLEGSPAERAGVLVGDRLLSVEGKPFEPIESFRHKAGQKVSLLVQRLPEPNNQEPLTVIPKRLDAQCDNIDETPSPFKNRVERKVNLDGYATQSIPEQFQAPLC